MKVIGVKTNGKRQLTDGGGEGTTYTGDANLTVGGIENGTVFNEASMQNMWYDLLHTYYRPAFTSFNIDNISTLYEVGYTIPAGAHTFNWGCSNAANVKPASVVIDGPGGFGSPVTGLSSAGPLAVVFSTPILNSAPGSVAWHINGKNTQEENMTQATYTTQWQWRIYYGSSSLTTLNEAEIEALAHNQLKADSAGTYAIDGIGYKFLAIPESFTEIKNFFDVDGGFAAAMYDGYEQSEPVSNPKWTWRRVSITNVNGITTDYRLYRTMNFINGPLTLQASIS